MSFLSFSVKKERALFKNNFTNSFLLFVAMLLTVFSSWAQAPTITFFNTQIGAPGTLFTITGTNLSNSTDIKIGGVTGSAIVISNTGTSLVSMVMPGAATGTVTVTTANGTATSSGTFTVQNTSYPIVQQGTKLTASNDVLTPGKGWSVALSADGKTALVGGYYDNNGVGATWVYTRTGNTWAQQEKLIGTGAAVNAWQGFSVALSADGNTAIVGGVIDNSAWVFTRSGATWAQQGPKLVGSDRVGNAWFGKSVSLSADGNTAIVGGYQDNTNAGAAWVFTRSGSTWAQQGTKLVGTGAVGAAGQGHSVSLSADGNIAAIGGAYDDSQKGATWIFTRSGNTWVHQKIVVPGVGAAKQGQSVVLSADATTLIIGGVNATSNVSNAWVFTRSGSTWTQQGSTIAGLDAVGTAANGTSVSLSADGNTAMMGSVSDNNNTGAAWVFSRSGASWTQEGNKFLGTGAVGTTLYQGRSVALSADGTNMLVGADGDNTNLGAVWSYSTGVTYDGNGNTGGVFPSSTLATIGSSITLATNSGTLVKTGYTFAGWNTLSNGTGTSYAEGASYTFAGTVRLYANWIPNNYTVTFNVNGGTGSMSNQTIAYNASSNLTTNAFIRTGYTFAGWNTLTNGTGTSYANATSYTMGAENVTLYAQWTLNNYTVTFLAGSGTGSMANQTIAYNATAYLNLNTFTRTGYTPDGWLTLVNNTWTYIAEGALYTMGAADVTLYANWIPNNYTVTFNVNGGTGSMSNQTIANNASSNLTTNAFIRTGYTFAGWNTLTNGTGTSYANGTSYTMGGANVTLYAQWTLNNYTVTFNVNGGTGSMSNQTITYNASSNLTSNTFTRTYYTFAGWNTLADGTGTSYANATSYTMGEANVTLYAQWTPNNYTVSFIANSGTGTMTDQSIAYDSSANLTSNGFTRTDYTFDGWNTLADGTGTSYANGTSYNMGAANVTLYAQWNCNTAVSTSSTPTLCINTPLTNITHTTAGATGIGTETGLPTGVTVAWANNTITISGTPTASGTFNYSIPLTGGCGVVSATGTITVNENYAVGAASSTPTLCINTGLTDITHTTTGASGIGITTGLPNGVTALWDNNTITISGAPSVTGIFNYSIPLTGGCVNATGTITVNANNTVGTASITPTLFINTTLTNNITHTTTGATGIGIATGLPTGVIAAWADNTITISGIPTVLGTFNYSIPLIGGCGSDNAIGTITVTPNNTIGNAYVPQKMTYQWVLRSSNNALITNTVVGTQISVLQGSASGTAVYVETQTTATNANGLVSVAIGSGTAITSTFASIDWANGPYFVKTETDPAGGSNYNITGTQEMLSVPYALYAAHSNDAGPQGPIGLTGATGPQGPIGLTGATGAAGVNGAVGGFTHYIGEVFNGGIIYHLYRGSDGLEHGLIVSLTESSTGLSWQANPTVVNANSFDDGAYNTALMTNSPAADYIASLGAGWYLASSLELNKLFQNRFHVNKALSDSGSTVLSTNYWSSTEGAGTQAYNQTQNYFTTSTSPSNNTSPSKLSPYKVRGIRSF